MALSIFMAAVMAGVVLPNLTNTYILQKKRELTIMRINGFSVREVIGYVTRETAFVQYNRRVSLPAWAFGAVITALFTIIINAIVLRRVKHLKLTDIT